MYFLYYFQIDMIGQSMEDFIHPCDLDEFYDLIHQKVHKDQDNKDSDNERVFLIRMKCTLTSKGRNVNLKSAAYKVCYF